MGIFKKLFSFLDKDKTMEKAYNPMLTKIIEEKREKGLKNFLSPHQVQQVIDNNTLASLTLLIAESNPKEKELMIDLITNFFN